MVAYSIILALINGLLITINRIVNARLAVGRGAVYSSVINHVVGALVLAPIVIVMYGTEFLASVGSLDPILYIGGIIGGVFVSINSFLIPRLGSTPTIILIIAGQTLGGVALDFVVNRVENPAIASFGCLFLLGGIWFSKQSLKKEAESKN